MVARVVILALGIVLSYSTELLWSFLSSLKTSLQLVVTSTKDVYKGRMKVACSLQATFTALRFAPLPCLAVWRLRIQHPPFTFRCTACTWFIEALCSTLQYSTAQFCVELLMNSCLVSHCGIQWTFLPFLQCFP